MKKTTTTQALVQAVQTGREEEGSSISRDEWFTEVVTLLEDCRGSCRPSGELGHS